MISHSNQYLNTNIIYLQLLVQEQLSTTSYLFPNKSLFNNAAQFTKERRLRGMDCNLEVNGTSDSLHSLPFDSRYWDFSFVGFDELMKLISSMNLYSVDDVQTFLEINERMPESVSSSRPHSSKSRKPALLAKSTAITDSTATSDDEGKEDAEEEDDVEDNEEEKKRLLDVTGTGTGGDQSTGTGTSSSNLETEDELLERKINAMIKEQFMEICTQSVKVSSVVYSCFFLSGIIDFYSVEYRELLVTWVALTLLVCFIFIISMKNEAKKR